MSDQPNYTIKYVIEDESGDRYFLDTKKDNFKEAEAYLDNLISTHHFIKCNPEGKRYSIRLHKKVIHNISKI